MRPPSVRQRRASTEKHNTTSPPIDKVPYQFLLVGSKVSGLDTPDDQAVVNKQILRLGGKAVCQSFPVVRIGSLGIDFVLRGTDHGRELQAAVLFHCSMNELIFPAR